MRTFALCLNNDFDARVLVHFILRSKQYDSLVMARYHLYLESSTVPL